MAAPLSAWYLMAALLGLVDNMEPLTILKFVRDKCQTIKVGFELSDQGRPFLKKITKWMNSHQKGATMVEYSIMVALIATVCIAVVFLLGEQVNAAFCLAVTALGGGC
jgi:Flp pilus assembly pilin Flp